MTGISGSGISSSAAQTSAAYRAVVTTAPRARSAAPRSSPPSSSASSGVCSPRSCASTTLEPDAARQARDAARARARRARSGHSSSTAVAEARLVAQARRPHLGVQAVVDLLAVDLRREPGELVVVGLLQRFEADAVGLLVEVAARDRVRPVEQAQLDERRTAVVLGRAVERERVGVVPSSTAASSYSARAWPISFCAIDENATSSSSVGAIPVHSESRQPRISSSSASAEEQLCPLAHAPPSGVP